MQEIQAINEMNEKPIKNFEIIIGQGSIGGIPMGEPMLVIIINDRKTQLYLKEFKKIIDTIIESKGTHDKKSCKAFDDFKSIFSNLLFPFFDYHAMRSTNNAAV